MPIKKSDTIRRTYERISPNFPPELESILHTVVKESSVTDIVNYTEENIASYMRISGELDKKEIRSLLKIPGMKLEPISLYALGNYIYKKISDRGFKDYLLTNDISVFPDFDRWIFRMRSLSNQILKGGLKVYYSIKTPEIEIEGRKYRIAYTWHCIERIHERAKRKMFDYGSLGDLYALLNDNNCHEYALLNDGSRALSMYGFAGNELSLSFNIVTKILGDQYYPDNTYYYRLGYFPIDIMDNFAVCKTLLSPGFFNTPEYKLLRNSPENMEWLKRANENGRNDSLFTFDLELIKKLHELGVPQIKTFDDDVYTYR